MFLNDFNRIKKLGRYLTNDKKTIFLILIVLIPGFKGLKIEQSLIKVDLPFMLLTTFACLPIFWSKGKISRIEGFILLNLYIFYILDKILFLNGFNYLFELRIILFIYFLLLVTLLFAQEKFKFSK